MKKILCITTALLCILFSACGKDNSVGIIGGADGPTEIYVSEEGEKAMYIEITAKDARRIMDSGEDFVILDVREQDEYDEGHIPGAILIPYTEIDQKAKEMLPDKGKQILVYCRSGR